MARLIMFLHLSITISLSVESLLTNRQFPGQINRYSRCCQNQCSSDGKKWTTHLIASPSLSLDRTLVPSSTSGGDLIASLSVLFLTALLSWLGVIARRWEGVDLVGRLRELLMAGARLSSTLQTFGIFRKLLPKSGSHQKSLSSSSWQTCKLKKKMELTNELSLFRFQCDKSFSLSELSLGQQMTLCSTDSRGRVLKDNFFPFSFSKGSFDVLGLVKDHKILFQLEGEDEVAYKKGKVQLKFVSDDEEEVVNRTTTTTTTTPVDGMSIITSGVGVAPTLQTLHRILTDTESAVESIDVLWINERKEDFVLNDFMEDLEDKFGDKLFVARVVDRQFSDSNSQINDKLRDAMVPFREGRMAMVITSEEIQTKSSLLLQSVGYPLSTSVVTIKV